MQRGTFALWALGVGLVLGVLGNIFFYDKTVGLSFPAFVLLAVIAVLASVRPAGQTLRRRNLWPLLPLLFFAGMVAVRDDLLLGTLNVLATLALGGLVLHYLPLPRPLDEDSLLEQTGGALDAGFRLPAHAAGEVRHAWDWLREKRQQRGGVAASVVRGLMFAAPVLLVFVFLLGSADAVFASYVNQAWNGLRRALGLQTMGDALPRVLFMLFIGMLGTGAVAYAWARQAPFVRRRYLVVGPMTAELPADDDETAAEREAKTKPSIKLSMIESGIILGSVVALFGVFVVIQFAYFFGGQDTVVIEGLTYAVYARRGFFELVAVSVLTLGLALWLDRVTVRQEQREQTLFRVLCVLLVGLTVVLLVSAFRRMVLYEDAFGFTQLRVYTHVFMHWLGVLLGVFALSLFWARKNLFSLGTLLVIIGYLVTLNLLNVDYYIAERNIARYHDGQELDIAFLRILSADAAPAVIPLYAESEPDSRVHTWSGQWLARSLMQLDRLRSEEGILSANLSRQQAWQQLDAMRDRLPVYDPAIYLYSSYSGRRETYSDYGSGWQIVPTPTGSGR